MLRIDLKVLSTFAPALTFILADSCSSTLDLSISQSESAKHVCTCADVEILPVDGFYANRRALCCHLHFQAKQPADSNSAVAA